MKKFKIVLKIFDFYSFECFEYSGNSLLTLSFVPFVVNSEISLNSLI
jgi:hypothetical protein